MFLLWYLLFVWIIRRCVLLCVVSICLSCSFVFGEVPASYIIDGVITDLNSFNRYLS